ncbi:MAG: hypothetical protein OEO20_10595 [Gemmatimonadota bacterium]|nr:hypothetical protein [Gemmatimonadota bacterium]MDH3369483.1 hypothetical protein [Gemmatimonadota bacterium]MDH3478741.1 hypothetical protein [Gemmatimonadota bacterium]MDH3571918.1 hypothetical protein [Gemmatimonadota bacterium]MDH5551610.1 hypothetical protein [Gemmatimonadota bacterium]
MIALQSIRRSAYVVIAALIPLAIGCGDGVEPPPGLVGTWDATSLVVDGFDLMDDGMTLSYTLTSGGNYSYVVTGDLSDYCDPGPDCSDSGDFTATGTQLTFDEGTAFEETYSYTIVGTTLTISATFGQSTYAFTFEKR